MSLSGAAEKRRTAPGRDRGVTGTALGLGDGLLVSAPPGGTPGFTMPPFEPPHVHGKAGGTGPAIFGLTRWR